MGHALARARVPGTLRVGRPIRVKLHGKKREHDPDSGDSSLTRGAYVHNVAVYCVQSVRANGIGWNGGAVAAILHAINWGVNAGITLRAIQARQELDRLEEKNRNLRRVTTEVLTLATELRKGTIDRIMAMSDLELCLRPCSEPCRQAAPNPTLDIACNTLPCTFTRMGLPPRVPTDALNS